MWEITVWAVRHRVPVSFNLYVLWLFQEMITNLIIYVEIRICHLCTLEVLDRRELQLFVGKCLENKR